MDHVPSHSSGPKWYHLGTLPEITEANVSSKEEVKGKRRTKWFVGYSKPGREKPTDTCLRYPWCGTYVKFQVHPPHFSAGHTFTGLRDKAQAHQAEQVRLGWAAGSRTGQESCGWASEGYALEM